jgi:hypothetical protein
VAPPPTGETTAGNPLPARVCVSCRHHKARKRSARGETPLGQLPAACETVRVPDNCGAAAQARMASSAGHFSDQVDKDTRATGVGDLVLSTEGSWMVRPPEFCANRHRLAGNCIVSSQPCRCQDRHVSWSCNSCGHVTYGPMLGPACNLLDGPAWVR